MNVLHSQFVVCGFNENTTDVCERVTRKTVGVNIEKKTKSSYPIIFFKLLLLCSYLYFIDVAEKYTRMVSELFE